MLCLASHGISALDSFSTRPLHSAFGGHQSHPIPILLRCVPREMSSEPQRLTRKLLSFLERISIRGLLAQVVHQVAT
eukprot:4662810-Amphidinium_carterae.1